MDSVSLPAGSYRPGYELVAEQILRLIAELELRPGDRMPTENELAAQLGSSRTVVREAVKILSAIGRVRAQKGRGLYVSDDDGMLGSGRWGGFFHPTDLDHVYTHRAVLDVGAGLGTTASSVRRRMYGTHGVSSSWTLVENDVLAARFHRLTMPPLGRQMDVTSLKSVPRNGPFDAAIFIHSAYYFPRFDAVLGRLFADVLAPHGVVICLALPRRSPFFVPALENSYPWVAEEIVRASTAAGCRSRVTVVRTRFRWLKPALDDHALAETITSFMLGRRRVSSREIAIAARHMRGELDFADRLIVIDR